MITVILMFGSMLLGWYAHKHYSRPIIEASIKLRQKIDNIIWGR